eukprot:2659186-Pyramimonas_sp.AAC.1
MSDGSRGGRRHRHWHVSYPRKVARECLRFQCIGRAGGPRKPRREVDGPSRIRPASVVSLTGVAVR